MTSLNLQARADSADVLVVGVGTSGGEPRVAAAPGLTAEQVQALSEAVGAVGATGRPDEVLRLPGAPFGLPRILATGLGPDGPDAERLRRATGAALRVADGARVAVALPTGDDPDLVEATALGALIGSYRYPGRPAARRSGEAPKRIDVLAGGERELAPALARASAIGNAVRLARRLVDTPPADLPPATLAAEAEAVLAGSGVAVEVLDEQDLARGGYGGILGVGQGSANPPRLVRLTYQPDGAGFHLAVAGKGITFDSGGLSLKPAVRMPTMKMDMAGAAAVLAGVWAIAELGIRVRITGYLAIAENMPSGAAQRPGDVITAYDGTTVEVLNTDAEGRLVLMDALSRALEDSPDAIVDLATLTGAQMVALGARIAAVMGNDDEWRDRVRGAADAAGELAWSMPIPEELRPSLDSPVADLANVGERNGAMMTAAAFLREFIDDTPWAHMDIAGPAWVDSAPWAYNGKGATGYGVRTLVALAEQLAATSAVPGDAGA